MDRRTRICIWVILIGLANFVAYGMVYVFIGGEAVNGTVRIIDGQRHYMLQSGQPVSRGVFLYSGIHSISIWITVAAVMLAMLTLAKERIVSSMRAAIVRGRTFITAMATVITFITIVLTVWFILQFSRRLANPQTVSPKAPTTHAAQR